VKPTQNANGIEKNKKETEALSRAFINNARI
jgi:hypothetical protein